MDASFKQTEMTIYKIAVQLEQLIKKEPSDKSQEWLDRLAEIQRLLQTRKFRMAVVGEFNRGKSSFINVLLGRRILPEDVLATTATINRVTYGEKPRAYLVFHDGTRSAEEIPVDELADHITKLTQESAANAARIKEAVLEFPTMLCYDDVDLIDTPGMNDMDDMNAVTVNQLENIDLAVVAINAQYPFSETECHFVTKLLESKMVCQIIFVVTYIDMIRKRDRARLIDFMHKTIPEKVLGELNKSYSPDDSIFQKYHEIFDHARIYTVSSRDAMDALEENDMELFEQSGYLKLRNELPQVILSSKSVNMMRNFTALLLDIIKEYQNSLRNAGNQLELWQQVRQKYTEIISQELQTLTEETKRVKQPPLTAELEETAVTELLTSLGSVSVLTPDTVQAAMLPVMQQIFSNINTGISTQNIGWVHDISTSVWSQPLDRILNRIHALYTDFPSLAPQLEPLEAWVRETLESWDQPAYRNCVNALNTDPEQFYWLESPIALVLQTAENTSVLPGLKRIVSASLADFEARNHAMLENLLTDACSTLGQTLDAVLTELDQRLASIARENPARGDLEADLQSLQQTCEEIHSKIHAVE